MQQQLRDALLQQLRDVHDPVAVSWWPPAVGWWLAVVLIAIMIYFAWKIRLQHRRYEYRREGLRRLHQAFLQWQQDGDAAAYLAASNRLLKQCMLASGAPQHLMAYNGHAWQKLLQDWPPQPLDEQSAMILSHYTYHLQPEFELAHLHQALEKFIRHFVAQHRLEEPLPC